MLKDFSTFVDGEYGPIRHNSPLRRGPPNPRKTATRARPLAPPQQYLTIADPDI